VRLLRPERLRLSANPPEAGERGLRARVRELAFQGATVEVRLSGENDLPLIAIDTTAHLPDHLRVGEELWCRWDPADSHLLEPPSP
jgi:ABC-type Fe3+/spermidine/putrescine transport system ATPase subunit